MCLLDNDAQSRVRRGSAPLHRSVPGVPCCWDLTSVLPSHFSLCQKLISVLPSFPREFTASGLGKFKVAPDTAEQTGSQWRTGPGLSLVLLAAWTSHFDFKKCFGGWGFCIISTEVAEPF